MGKSLYYEITYYYQLRNDMLDMLGNKNHEGKNMSYLFCHFFLDRDNIFNNGNKYCEVIITKLT